MVSVLQAEAQLVVFQPATQSQALDDRYINIRNMLST